MSNERLYFCLALALVGLTLLGVAAGLKAGMFGAPAVARPAGSGLTVTAGVPPAGEQEGVPRVQQISQHSPGVLVWPVGLLGAALLGSAFAIVLRDSRVTGRGPRHERRCARCGRRLDHDFHAALTCSGCGAPTRCPQCAADLTRGAADVCAACGAPWGCRLCGHSLKGLASNPCTYCHAPVVCRCGAELTHNITGRCGQCGARIAGWREWK